MLKNLFPLLVVFLSYSLSAQRLSDVPLLEDSLGYQKKIDLDFTTMLPICWLCEATDIYTISYFCYQGKKFSRKKKFSKAIVKYTHKYDLPILIEVKLDSYEGQTHCIINSIPDIGVLVECNTVGKELKFFECEPCEVSNE